MKVIISTLHNGPVTPDYAYSLAALMLENPYDSIKGIHYTKTARNHHGRNTAIKRFLETDADVLMWIDDDMAFDPGAYKILYEEMAGEGDFQCGPDVYMVAGLAFIYDADQGTQRPTCLDFNEEANEYQSRAYYPKNGRFFCDSTGAAFVMIHRDIFEATGPLWHLDTECHPETMKPMGHDVAFFHNARKITGERVWYCADAKTGHVKTWQASEDTYEAFLVSQGLPTLDGMERAATLL